MDITEKNHQSAKAFLEKGLEALKVEYEIEPLSVEGYENLSVAGMCFKIVHYSIGGVGHLQTMEVLPGGPVQMSTFTLTPYFKNLPLLSFDFMFTGEKRVNIMEVYELVEDRQAAVFRESVAAYKAVLDSLGDLPVVPSAPYWADEIRPVFLSSSSAPDQDERVLNAFAAILARFIKDEKALPKLQGEALEAKHDITAEYVENLVTKGGMTTDMWKAKYGEEFIREFFEKIFFGVK